MSAPPPFANEPTAEFRRGPVRDAHLGALGELDRSLPFEVPILVGGDARMQPVFDSVDPADPGRVVARSSEASHEDVLAAVEAATRSRTRWGDLGAERRAAVLGDAAERLRVQRPRLAALIVREAGKPWVDADAEVCEAIDFIEYYSRLALELGLRRTMIEPPGERNELRYVPRGVVAVIAPWNFPLAISTGMVVAGLATGNGVIYKPAEQTPACALALVRALYEAGVPPDALSLLPGGDRPGVALVEDPGVHTIAFTGSCAVGLEISRTAAVPAEGQRHLKRLIAEMGGKNCVIVDSDADLDEVIPAVCSSAFGFAGQKCSAASRLLVHGAVVEALQERLAGAVRSLVTGPPTEFGVDLGPLIDEESARRFDRYAAEAACAGEVLASGPLTVDGDRFRAPTVVAGLDPDSRVLSDEIFAPLLSLEAVASTEQACELVDGSPFGLTAGLFSRNPDTVAEVERRLPVGNLYVNRGITGAVVGRQPFGGNRLSGTGAKAGGPRYLDGFVEPRVVSENRMRHGLVV